MASKTTICNQALSHLAQGLELANIDTEKSEAGRACRAFFDVALETLLRRRDWSFARKRQALSYVGVDPTGTWAAVFRYPSDCVMIRGSGYPSQPVGFTATYALGADDAGTLIYGVDKTAYFSYTFRNTNTDSFPPDFTLALSYLLAYLIAPRMSGGDAANLGQAAYAAYNEMFSVAAVAAINEEGPKVQPQSAFQRARNS